MRRVCSDNTSGFGEQHNSKEAIVRSHCAVGKAHVQLEEFEDAVRAYQRAKDTKGDDHEANEGHGNAQKLLKMSKRKDYYKILGIDKSSSEQQIKKAYRRLALKLHPDKEPDPNKKASTEKKFKDVADAYEVLMDPEKKARFDNGEDLNEPQQQVSRSASACFCPLFIACAAQSLRRVRRRGVHVSFRIVCVASTRTARRKNFLLACFLPVL